MIRAIFRSLNFIKLTIFSIGYKISVYLERDKNQNHQYLRRKWTKFVMWKRRNPIALLKGIILIGCLQAKLGIIHMPLIGG